MSEDLVPQGDRLILSYLHGAEVVYQPREEMAPRTMFDYELVYLQEGTITYGVNGQEFVLPPGSAILGCPGFIENYRWDTAAKTRHGYFHFGIEQYPLDWPLQQDWPHAIKATPPVFPSMFRHLLLHAYEHDDWPAARPDAKDCRLLEVLLDTFLETPHSGPVSFERERPEPVRRALVYMHAIMDDNPIKHVTLNMVAEEAHVTEKHLCRLFSKTMNNSPMQVLTLFKLQSAQILLTRTNMSVKEIAEHSGFENPLYFSRRFAKQFGCSPSKFRNLLKTGQAPIKNILPPDLIPRSRI